MVLMKNKGIICPGTGGACVADDLFGRLPRYVQVQSLDAPRPKPGGPKPSRFYVHPHQCSAFDGVATAGAV